MSMSLELKLRRLTDLVDEIGEEINIVRDNYPGPGVRIMAFHLGKLDVLMREQLIAVRQLASECLDEASSGGG